MADYEVFREQLAIKYPSYGYALWEPRPRNPSRPVQVGDVGFIREGKFCRLFSAMLPADDPSQDFGVPEHHELLIPNISGHLLIDTLDRNNYCSVGVSTEEDPGYHSSPGDFPQVLFQNQTTRRAAVLSLPVTARRENTLIRNAFGRWMVKHIDAWFAFAQKLGLVDQMEEIIMVTGCDLTRSWTNIAFLGGWADARVSFGVNVDGPDSNTRINYQFAPERARGVVLHQGPEGTNLPENQCVFVRGFRVAPSLWILPKRLKAAAGPSSDPGGYDCDPDMVAIPTPAITQFRDPLHLLSDYIAEQASDCDKILVHDDDLSVIFGIDGIDDGTLLVNLKSDVMRDLLRKSNIKIHKFEFEDSFLNDSQSGQNADASTVKVATLSVAFQRWNLTPTSQWPHLVTQDIDLSHTNIQESRLPPPPRGSSTHPSQSKYLLPQGKTPARLRQSPNSRPTQDNSDEYLDKSNLQRHGTRPSDPPHQTPTGSSPVLRPAVSTPGKPSGNSRTPSYPPSPIPFQFSREHSFRSTRGSAGHHPSSTGPYDKPNSPSLDEAVRLPVSPSPGFQSTHGLQHFPEKTKPSIPIPYYHETADPNRKNDARQRQPEVHTYGAIAKTWETEAKKRDAEAQTSGAEFETREADAQIQEAEFQIREAEFQIREAEFQIREAEFQIREAEFQRREAEFQRREAEIQVRDAEVQTSEGAEAINKNDVALRLQKKAHSLVEAERNARHIGASATQKIAEAKCKKAEAQKRKIEVEKWKTEAQRNGEEARRREAEARQKEKMAKRNEEAVRRGKAWRKNEDAHRRGDDARISLEGAVQHTREAEARHFEKVRTKEDSKPRPAQEKATDHLSPSSQYFQNILARWADSATRLETTKADAANRSAGVESVAPQREDWVLEERPQKQLGKHEAQFDHELEAVVEQDRKREETIYLEEKIRLEEKVLLEEKVRLEEKEKILRIDQERHRILNEQHEAFHLGQLQRWKKEMLGQPTNLKNERKEIRPEHSPVEYSRLRLLAEHESRNNTGVPFGTLAPHRPAGPTSDLAENHAGVLSNPTLPNTGQLPMPTYTKSEEGWVKVKEDRSNQSGTMGGHPISWKGSESKERLESEPQAKNSNLTFVPDSKKRSTDDAKATGRN